MSEYIATIGLETHIQLNTLTKAFCSCKADSWNEPPNTNICPICTGQPGALPSPNAEMVHKAVLLCHAVHAWVAQVSFFDRKNYLYADMPNGYQVTQNDCPIGVDGYLDVEMEKSRIVRVRIDNLHMEEDAGKTRNEGDIRLIDFNRSGVPLVEMVTKPDLHSAEEAAAYLIQLRRLIRWIGISEGNMEKAQLRCDANVSVAHFGSDEPGRKCEIKNINSIDAVRKAISSEIERQIRELESGREVEQWTIEWDNDAKELRKMRSKENAVDYRFFREPNLMPVVLSDKQIKGWQKDLPEMPWVRKQRFILEYGLPPYDAGILTEERNLSDYYEKTLKYYHGDPKLAANWIINEILRLINDNGGDISALQIRPKDLAEIIQMVDSRSISPLIGKELVNLVQESGKTPSQITVERNLTMINDETVLREICEKIISANPKETAAYRSGRESLLGWFTGQVMHETKGKADAKLVGKIIKQLLE